MPNPQLAILFDLDGVLTPTADVHMEAWRALFTDFAAAHRLEPYQDEDYFSYIDGKPRYDGVASFLQSRAIELPWGSPDDGPQEMTVCGLGNRKDAHVHHLLATQPVYPYPGSVQFLKQVLELNWKVAVVSSSRNAKLVLQAAKLTEFFPVVVDGQVTQTHKIPGKPAPDMFWYAAELLEAQRNRCVVIEDAVAGVRAGAAGGFGGVVGVDRGVGADVLWGAGADLVINDLAEITPQELITELN